MQTRIYLVRGPQGQEWLVEATSAAQAIRHVASPKYSAHVATTKEVATAMSNGLQVENASVTETKQASTATTQGEVAHGIN